MLYSSTGSASYVKDYEQRKKEQNELDNTPSTNIFKINSISNVEKSRVLKEGKSVSVPKISMSCTVKSQRNESLKAARAIKEIVKTTKKERAKTLKIISRQRLGKDQYASDSDDSTDDEMFTSSKKKTQSKTGKQLGEYKSKDVEVTLYDNSGGEYLSLFKNASAVQSEKEKDKNSVDDIKDIKAKIKDKETADSVSTLVENDPSCIGAIPYDFEKKGQVRKDVMLNTYTIEEDEIIDGWTAVKCNSIVNKIVQSIKLNLFKSQAALKLYSDIGSKCNSAIMLTNPPGTGKTLLDAIKARQFCFCYFLRNTYGAPMFDDGTFCTWIDALNLILFN